ncbi:MAG: OmpA family protein [Cyclobacteriaceae bacterium]|nr:OmpA family protein [Cyclobacteriaceae bacterium]
MKKYIVFLGLIALSMAGMAQSSEPDSLVTYKAIIVDKFSGAPISGVSVEYKKLPYQSEIGLLSTDANGEFDAYFRARESYSLQLSYKGYLSLSEVIQPLEHADANLVRVDTFSMRPGGVGSVLALQNLNFEQGKSKITQDSFEELNNLVNLLKESPNMVIQLEGHTDFRGSPTANLELSEDRVKAVKDYLVSNGINTDRIMTKAFGGSQPITTENTAEARAKNRRVEVRILSE